MKIFLVDTEVSGHHISYIRALSELADNSIAVLPQKIELLEIPQYAIGEYDIRKPIEYIKWLKRIYELINKERPDCIHFLYADRMYRFFGIGLPVASKIKIVVTWHVIKDSFLRSQSMKRIFSRANLGVVHTKNIYATLSKLRISNVRHVEYPQMGTTFDIEKKVAKAYFGLDSNEPVFLALGGTRYNKGVDLLIEAANNVTKKCQLLVAGKEEYFKYSLLKSKLSNELVTMCTKESILSDWEFAAAIISADYIVLPYRKSFNGASGPLAESVSYGKTIIATNHGSLGQIVEDMHIGYTFMSEDSKSLGEVMEDAMKRNFIYDEVAQKYRESLTLAAFQKAYKDIYFEVTNGKLY